MTGGQRRQSSGCRRAMRQQCRADRLQKEQADERRRHDVEVRTYQAKGQGDDACFDHETSQKHVNTSQKAGTYGAHREYVGPIPVFIMPPVFSRCGEERGRYRVCNRSCCVTFHAKARTLVYQHGRAGFLAHAERRRCPRQSPLRMPRRRNPPGVPSPCCSNLRLGPTAYSCRSRG